MSETRPKKLSRLSGGVFKKIRRYTPEDMYTFPRIKLSTDWEIEQLQRKPSERGAVVLGVREQSVEELRKEISQIKQDMIKHNMLLQTSNNLMLELVNLLKLQASQAYFWSTPWIASEREAQKDIEEGNIDTFDSSEKIIKFLHED